MRFLVDVNVIFPLLLSRHQYRDILAKLQLVSFDRGYSKFTGLDFLLLASAAANESA
jgi:hypothetical protein